MGKIYNRMVILIFLGIIFIVPILTKNEQNFDYSIFENRNLAEVPILNLTELMEGGYLPKWDKYFSDHIWKRNLAIKQYTNFNMHVLNKIVINDVVVQKDILLPFIPYAYETYNFSEEAEAMADKLSILTEYIEAYGGKFIYVGVPEQYSMLRDYYPEHLNNDDAKLTLTENEFFSRLETKNINYINMKSEFLKEEDYLQYYSRTDHHYNLFGAFLTYQTIINKLIDDFKINLPFLTENDIEFISLENPFYGSRNRKLYETYEADDKLYYYTQKNPVTFSRYDYGNEVEPLVFHLPYDENSPVTYNIYMNGDIGETSIRTNREYLPNALIFGDSFTNPLETFLYNSFNETISLDLRNYDGKTIIEYIDEYKPDFVFCLRDDTAYLNTDGNGNIK